MQQISDLAEQSRGLVAGGMAEVDQFIVRKLTSEVALINQVSAYIVNNGGKPVSYTHLTLPTTPYV